jgi:hypothetical protein
MVHAVRLKVLASGTKAVDKEQRLKEGRNYCRDRWVFAGAKCFIFVAQCAF